MEAAFEDAGKKPVVKYYDRHASELEAAEGSVEMPLVYKIHGSVENPATLICTEDDLVEFLSNLIRGQPELPENISRLFNYQTMLFVGYGLKDWNIRVLLKSIRDPKAGKSYAVQVKPTGLEAAAQWARP